MYVYTTGDEEPVIRRVRTVDGDRNFVENLRPVEDHMACRAKLCFRFEDGEQIHGLGQGEEGIYDYRGHVQYLYQHNMRIPSPFFLSSRGYGLLADCGSLMTFNDDERGSYLFLDTVDQLDYYLVAGESVDEIIKGFRYLTGKAALLPKWAFGYVQSKERYTSQEELVSVAAEYRKRGVGLDCVVQDWKTWKGDDWGEKHVDQERFPDLPAMKRTLHDMHVHSMVSVWPNMNFDTENCREMREKGFLLHDLATYDAFNEEARRLYWQQAGQELFSGFDSWWCDSTEPFSGPDWGGETRREPWERFMLVGNEHKKFLGAGKANLYAVAHARGIYENQRKSRPDMRVLNLTRSGYPTIQKYGTMLWSGDITATWKTIRTQLTEGLNMAMSGMPWWTLDTGGFFTVRDKWQNRGCGCDTDPTPKWFWQGDYEEGVHDPGYRELYTRWMEFSAFLPMFRSHGTDTPREIWNFGEPGDMFYDAIAGAISLRYRLMPYIYSLAGQVYLEDATMMRSLLFDFADDPEAASMDTEYMFGKALLVCPVTEPMFYGRDGEKLSRKAEWPVYLPKGCGWYDLYSGTYQEGGRTVVCETPVDRIPVFVRAGSILPMEDRLTYADEKAETPLRIRVFPGADGEFAYYEDDGDGYGYEEGRFNRIPMKWDDGSQTFTIAACAHDFDGGIKGRKCVLEVSGKSMEFLYGGEEMSVTIQ